MIKLENHYLTTVIIIDSCRNHPQMLKLAGKNMRTNSILTYLQSTPPPKERSL